jgi:hypothetical protein
MGVMAAPIDAGSERTIRVINRWLSLYSLLVRKTPWYLTASLFLPSLDPQQLSLFWIWSGTRLFKRFVELVIHASSINELYKIFWPWKLSEPLDFTDWRSYQQPKPKDNDLLPASHVVNSRKKT